MDSPPRNVEGATGDFAMPDPIVWRLMGFGEKLLATHGERELWFWCGDDVSRPELRCRVGGRLEKTAALGPLEKRVLALLWNKAGRAYWVSPKDLCGALLQHAGTGAEPSCVRCAKCRLARKLAALGFDGVLVGSRAGYRLNVVPPSLSLPA